MLSLASSAHRHAATHAGARHLRLLDTSTHSVKGRVVFLHGIISPADEARRGEQPPTFGGFFFQHHPEKRGLYRRDVPYRNRQNANEELFLPSCNQLLSRRSTGGRNLSAAPSSECSLRACGEVTRRISSKDTCMYTHHPFSLLAQTRRSVSVLSRTCHFVVDSPVAERRLHAPCLFARRLFTTDVEKRNHLSAS